jgi:hypothetical protein
MGSLVSQQEEDDQHDSALRVHEQENTWVHQREDFQAQAPG